MILRPTRSKRTSTLFTFTTLFRSGRRRQVRLLAGEVRREDRADRARVNRAVGVAAHPLVHGAAKKPRGAPVPAAGCAPRPIRSKAGRAKRSEEHTYELQ